MPQALRALAAQPPPPQLASALDAAQTRLAEAARQDAASASAEQEEAGREASPRVTLGFSAPSKATAGGEAAPSAAAQQPHSDSEDDSDDEPEALQPFEDTDTLKHAKYDPRFLSDCLEVDWPGGGGPQRGALPTTGRAADHWGAHGI